MRGEEVRDRGQREVQERYGRGEEVENRELGRCKGEGGREGKSETGDRGSTGEG